MNEHGIEKHHIEAMMAAIQAHDMELWGLRRAIKEETHKRRMAELELADRLMKAGLLQFVKVDVKGLAAFLRTT